MTATQTQPSPAHPPMHRPVRLLANTLHRLLACSAGLLLGTAVYAADAPAPAKTTPASPATTASTSSTPTEISWDDLVPANWDPSTEFADLIEAGAASWEDTDPRAQELYARLRKVWDNAPVVKEMNGKAIRLPGYVVALEEGSKGMTEMLLVPNFGACIHTPPPPANQIIHVRFPTPVKGFDSLDAVWVSGVLEVQRTDNSDMGVSGYRLVAQDIQKYRE